MMKILNKKIEQEITDKIYLELEKTMNDILYKTESQLEYHMRIKMNTIFNKIVDELIEDKMNNLKINIENLIELRLQESNDRLYNTIKEIVDKDIGRIIKNKIDRVKEPILSNSEYLDNLLKKVKNKRVLMDNEILKIFQKVEREFENGGEK